MPGAGHRRDRRLKLEALFWLALVRLHMATRPFQKTLALHRRLEGKAPPDPGPDPELPARVEHAVERAARLLPGTHCLPQALAGRILLARRGIPCDLRIGVAGRGEEGLSAHAWLEMDGRAILGARAGQTFTPLENGRDSLP